MICHGHDSIGIGKMRRLLQRGKWEEHAVILLIRPCIPCPLGEFGIRLECHGRFEHVEACPDDPGMCCG